MLHAALTALLALQAASGSPNVVPPKPGTGGASSYPSGSSSSAGANPSSSSEGEAPPPEGSPGPAATPTPAPRRTTPTPTPKVTGDSLLVVNKTDNSVSILDAATGRLRTTVAVEAGPHEVEALADRQAAVSSYGRKDAPGRFVSIVDVVTGKVVSRIDLGEGSRPHGMKALRDGRLLVTTEGKKELAVVDTHGAKVAARYPTGKDVSHLVAATPDGKLAFVTTLSGSVTVIELSSGKILKDIPTGKGAEGIDATPDGREIWVTNRDANTITVIDVKMLAPVFTIQASEFPIRVKFTPNGQQALVSFTGSGDVRTYDTATRVEKARIPIGRDAVAGTETRVFQKRFGTSPAPVGLLITPDGKRAFVSASHADVVAVIDLEKQRIDDAWTAGHEPDGLALSIGPPAPPESAPSKAAPPGAPASPGRRVTMRRPG